MKLSKQIESLTDSGKKYYLMGYQAGLKEVQRIYREVFEESDVWVE